MEPIQVPGSPDQGDEDIVRAYRMENVGKTHLYLSVAAALSLMVRRLLWICVNVLYRNQTQSAVPKV